MKKIIVTYPLALLMVACTSQSAQQTSTDNNTAIASDTVSTLSASNDSLATDALSGATQIANETLFNGILIVSPQHRATVTPVMGGIVEETCFLPGNYVKKGATIALLQNPEFIELQQNYIDSKAQYDYLKAEYTRQQSLISQDASSRKKFQQSKADYLSMKSRLDAATAQLQLLRIDPATIEQNGIQPVLKITAPISGYITSMNINLGKYINDGESICELVDKENILLQLTAYEKDLPALTIGSLIEFQVNGINNHHFEATIISIGQEIDKMNRSLNVYASVKDSDPLFRPGMYVNAKVKKNM